MSREKLEQKLAPIKKYLDDFTVNKIYVNGYDQVYVEKPDSFIKADSKFANDGELEDLIEELAAEVGRTVSGNEPAIHFRLKDGTTVAVFRSRDATTPLLCLNK